MHEAQLHEFKCFVTLTYDDDHLPENRTLVKKHFQEFMKNLRRHKQFAGIKIKYFMCGEYGEQTLRPHYHALIYGIDFPDKKLYSKRQGNLLFTSALLDKIWGRGECKIGALTFQSAAYVARYTLQKSGKKFPGGHYRLINKDTGETHDVLPEYGQASLRPAIGHDWYLRYASDIHNSDSAVVGGKEFKPPRYYDKLLKRHNPEKHENIKNARLEKQDQQSWNSTPERLRVRETVKKAATTYLKRNSL